MTPTIAVIYIQQFLAKSITWIDLSAEQVIIEGIAYVWQKNHEWSDDFTATVIAMLLGNAAPLFDASDDHDLYQNPF